MAMVMVLGLVPAGVVSVEAAAVNLPNATNPLQLTVGPNITVSTTRGAFSGIILPSSTQTNTITVQSGNVYHFATTSVTTPNWVVTGSTLGLVQGANPMQITITTPTTVVLGQAGTGVGVNFSGGSFSGGSVHMNVTFSHNVLTNANGSRAVNATWWWTRNGTTVDGWYGGNHFRTLHPLSGTSFLEAYRSHSLSMSIPQQWWNNNWWYSGGQWVANVRLNFQDGSQSVIHTSFPIHDGNANWWGGNQDPNWGWGWGWGWPAAPGVGAASTPGRTPVTAAPRPPVDAPPAGYATAPVVTNLPHPTLAMAGLPAMRLTIGQSAFTHWGITVAGDAAPFIDPDYDRTMVPLRIIAEALDAQVRWEGGTRTVYITRGGVQIRMPIGEPLPDGMGTPVIVNDRTFVPLRYISEIMGANVRWDDSARAVYIYRG